MSKCEINSNLLTLLRSSRGITQKELSLQTGIDTSLISKYEAGYNPILFETLKLIANALKYPISKLTDTSKRIYPPISHHRTKTKLNSLQEQQLDSIPVIRSLEIEELYKHIDLKINIPKLSFEEVKNSSPKEIADMCRTYWGIPNGPIDNILIELESNGITIFEIDYKNKDYDGFSFWSNQGYPLIFINKNLPLDRYRFTLAHELGHIIMHRHGGLHIEKQADEFAGHFLISDDILLSLGDKVSFAKLSILKEKWGVSIQAIGHKLIYLKKVTKIDEVYKKLYSKGYSKKKEPPLYSWERKQPTLLRNICRFFSSDLNWTLKDFASSLSLLPEEADSIYNLKDFSQFINLVKASDFNKYSKLSDFHN